MAEGSADRICSVFNYLLEVNTNLTEIKKDSEHERRFPFFCDLKLPSSLTTDKGERMQLGTTLTSKRVLRIKQLSQTVGLARSTIYDYLDPKSPRHDPTFPRPIKLGASAVGWLEAEINEWIGSKITVRSLVTRGAL